MQKVLIEKRHQTLVNGGDGGHIGLYNSYKHAIRNKKINFKDIDIEKHGNFYHVFGIR